MTHDKSGTLTHLRCRRSIPTILVASFDQDAAAVGVRGAFQPSSIVGDIKAAADHAGRHPGSAGCKTTLLAIKISIHTNGLICWIETRLWERRLRTGARGGAIAGVHKDIPRVAASNNRSRQRQPPINHERTVVGCLYSLGTASAHPPATATNNPANGSFFSLLRARFSRTRRTPGAPSP
jgi:hypothetical protein